MKLPFFLVALLIAPIFAQAQETPSQDPFQAAITLKNQGETEQAFAAFLKIAGGEDAAAKIARPEARKFLEKLGALQDISPARRELLKGELHFVLGEKELALKAFQNAARDWEKDGYPVEIPLPAREDQYRFGDERLALPFANGAGSHRDNWLIRRFIALQAWDDAAREFARVWELQRLRARPYLVSQMVIFDLQTQTNKERIMRVTPAGFDGFGLQFAVDYAYFLKRQGQTEKALAVLREPLEAMDLENRAGNLSIKLVSDAEIEAAKAAGEPIRNWRDANLGWDYINHGRGVRTLLGARLSSAEFVRLAWGEWKAANKTDELIQILQTQIAGGKNSARRVLALLKRHEGDLETAKTLELAFIENADFSPFQKAVRRGQIFKEFGELRDAAREYEIALTKPAPPSDIFNPLTLPRGTLALVDPYDDVREELIRIYGALGETERVLDLTLENLELNVPALENLDVLQQTEKRFQTAKMGARWDAWLRQQVAKASSPTTKANLFWLLEDYQATLRELAKSAQNDANFYHLEEWRKRFAARGKGSNLAFLQTLANAQPQNGRWQLALLRAQNRTTGADLVRSLELWLQTADTSGRSNDFGRRGPFLNGKPRGSAESANGTQYKSVYELALHLMRLYDRAGQNAKVQDLALQIANGEKPFRKNDFGNGSEPNGEREFGNAALALAIARGDSAEREKLAEALGNSRWTGAKAQLRRLKTGLKTPQNPAFGWANTAQNGARVLASNENVLALCRDEKRIFAGHPWGVAVYDLSGEPITRVALGVPALHLARLGGALFVGNADGLRRVDVANWKIESVDLPPSLPENDADSKRMFGHITALATQNDKLWIATRRDVRLFDPKTKEMQVWTGESLGLEQYADVNRFLFDGRFVWIDGYYGARRFDPQNGLWRAPPKLDEREAIHLVDIVKGEVWGDAYLGDKLRHRPCRFDAQTLEAIPIRIIGDDQPGDQFLRNSRFSFYGFWKDKSVWGDGYPRFYFDEKSKLLKPLPQKEGTVLPEVWGQIESEIPRGLLAGEIWRRADGAIVCRETERANWGATPFLTRAWTALPLKNGELAIGGAFPNVADFARKYGGESGEWPFDIYAHETPDNAGGLFLGAKNGEAKRISSGNRPDALAGDIVFDAVSDDSRGAVWLATQSGLAGLKNGQIFARLSQSDGLLGNRLTSGAVTAGGKLWFATHFDDDGGGLIGFDPKTTLFQSFFDVDGLPSNAVENLEARPDGKLQLQFGAQYRRWGDFKNQQQPAGWFDPKTGAFSPTLAPNIVKNSGVSHFKPLGTLPVLGGPIIARKRLGGKLFLMGTRGAVIEGNAPFVAPKIARIAVKLRPDARQTLILAAKKRPVSVGSLANLKTALADENPFFRARVLASLLGKSLLADADVRAEIVGQLQNPEIRVRATALGLLANLPEKQKLNSTEIAPLAAALKPRLNDEDPRIRDWAALVLLKLGEVPDLAILRAQLARRDGGGNLPFGADSSIGSTGKDAFYRALVPLATAPIFGLLVEFPPSLNYYEFDKTVFPALGAALLRHPDAAPVLLEAYDAERYNREKRDFAQNVFRFAGKDAVPLLQPALQSQNRVVRSNAARALGALGEPSSIPLLLAALDLESGLSRASVVWALGELKARQALPKLATLYTELKNAPAQSGGFLAAQSMAQNNSQYLAINANAEANSSFNALQNVDGVAGDYAAIQMPAKVNPRLNEDLLGADDILAAVKKIAPDAMGQWYRALAASEKSEVRRESAINLAPGAPDEKAENLVVLRHLLSDSDPKVRLSAAVSLWVLGEKDGQKTISGALENENGLRVEALRELARVEPSAKLAVFRAPIQAIAQDQELHQSIRALAKKLGEI